MKHLYETIIHLAFLMNHYGYCHNVDQTFQHLK